MRLAAAGQGEGRIGAGAERTPDGVEGDREMAVMGASIGRDDGGAGEQCKVGGLQRKGG